MSGANWVAILIIAGFLVYILVIWSICRLNSEWDRKEERERMERLYEEARKPAPPDSPRKE